MQNRKQGFEQLQSCLRVQLGVAVGAGGTPSQPVLPPEPFSQQVGSLCSEGQVGMVLQGQYGREGTHS